MSHTWEAGCGGGGLRGGGGGGGGRCVIPVGSQDNTENNCSRSPCPQLPFFSRSPLPFLYLSGMKSVSCVCHPPPSPLPGFGLLRCVLHSFSRNPQINPLRTISSYLRIIVIFTLCPIVIDNVSRMVLTLEALRFFLKTLETKGFFSIWNHHTCLSQLFLIHFNTYLMGLRPLEIF